MCGICGQLNVNGGVPIDGTLIRRMTTTLTHRGPDDEGLYLNGEVGLGFRRLSIIDAQGGHQPMPDSTGRVWIVFNGEIYNHLDLKRTLEAKGHVFRTRSDTEAIVAGYKEWGLDVVGRLNGMFGLAIWDAPRRRLLLARDRAGIKPLYYHLDRGTLTFASEIRPLLQHRDLRPRPDPVALNLFLRHRFAPAPLTLFRDIRKLAAGTRLVAEGGEVRVERWWGEAPRLFDPPPSPEEAEEHLLELYRRAVGRQLMSDVPLGLLLSGGVDSALMLALMNGHGSDWRTYTVGFGDSFADDELADAAETARVLKAPNAPVLIDRAAFEATLPRIINIVEEPVASASVVPMYFVSERARQDVKVALMGQGPDELFGGYGRHVGIRYGPLWRSLPQGLRAPIAGALRLGTRSERLRRGLHALGEPDRMRRYQRAFELLPGEQVDALFRPNVLRDDCDAALRRCWSDLEPLVDGVDELGGLQCLEVRSSLPDELLMYGDKVSMHHGLEVRVPYLDAEIIEYVERLPARLKMRGGRGKWLHRRVCRGLLPPAFVRRQKRGFAVNVVDDWFRSHMASRFGELLTDEGSLMYSMLRPDRVRSLLEQHRSGRENNHKLLFSLVMFEEWMRNYCG